MGSTVNGTSPGGCGSAIRKPDYVEKRNNLWQNGSQKSKILAYQGSGRKIPPAGRVYSVFPDNSGTEILLCRK